MSDSTSEQELATHPMAGHDAFSPPEVALLVETRGVAKATAPVVTTFVLGLVAGAFIALGAVLAIRRTSRVPSCQPSTVRGS